MEANLWRGTTADDRAADRRAHLLDVALELVGEKGAGGLTVRELYGRAKLNPRYFYESFTDLDERLRLWRFRHYSVVARAIGATFSSMLPKDASQPSHRAIKESALSAFMPGTRPLRGASAHSPRERRSPTGLKRQM